MIAVLGAHPSGVENVPASSAFHGAGLTVTPELPASLNRRVMLIAGGPVRVIPFLRMFPCVSSGIRDEFEIAKPVTCFVVVLVVHDHAFRDRAVRTFPDNAVKQVAAGVPVMPDVLAALSGLVLPVPALPVPFNPSGRARYEFKFIHAYMISPGDTSVAFFQP